MILESGLGVCYSWDLVATARGSALSGTQRCDLRLAQHLVDFAEMPFSSAIIFRAYFPASPTAVNEFEELFVKRDLPLRLERLHKDVVDASLCVSSSSNLNDGDRRDQSPASFACVGRWRLATQPAHDGN